MLLDLQVFVIRDTLQKLTKVYKTYCTKCIDGFVSNLSGYLVRLYVGATTKITRILSMLYIPLGNAHAYFGLIFKCWIKKLCSNFSLFYKPQRHRNC